MSASEVEPARAGDVAKQAASERARLIERAGIVGAGTLASRLLGLARDMALAAVFRRAETDAFFVAFTIPNALRQILGEGAVSSAVVPVLSSKLDKEGDQAAQAFFARVRAASLVALTVVTVLGMVFAGPLCELFARGYHARPGQFERTVDLTRTVFPYIFFMGVAALGMAALNAKRKFAVAAFAPGLLNVAFLIATFTLPGLLARHGIDRAQAIALGALLGGALQVVAQWPALRRIGFSGRPIFDLRDPGVRQVLARIAPLTFGIGVYYVDLVLSRQFLSELGEGAQSYFSWAMRLCDFPQGIFVMALSTAALPAMSTLASRGAKEELTKTYAHSMRLSLFVSIPASAALVFLAEPLVVAIFQRGEFDAVASRETARAVVYQGAAIWTVAAVRQIVPVFYALGDTRTPVVVSAVDLAAFVGIALLLRGPMGHAGVSAAVAMSSLVQMLLLFAGLKRRIGTVCAREIGGSAVRTGLASAIAGVAGWAIARLVATDDPGAASALVRTLPGVLGGGAFVVVFFVAAWGARAPELDILLRGVRRRLARRARPAA